MSTSGLVPEPFSAHPKETLYPLGILPILPCPPAPGNHSCALDAHMNVHSSTIHKKEKWKQLTCPSMRWLNKQNVMSIKKYCLTTKGMKFWQCYKWMNLKNIMLSERNTSKVTHCMIPLFKMSGTGKSIETESRLVVHCNLNLKMPF